MWTLKKLEGKAVGGLSVHLALAGWSDECGEIGRRDMAGGGRRTSAMDAAPGPR